MLFDSLTRPETAVKNQGLDIITLPVFKKKTNAKTVEKQYI